MYLPNVTRGHLPAGQYAVWGTASTPDSAGATCGDGHDTPEPVRAVQRRHRHRRGGGGADNGHHVGRAGRVHDQHLTRSERGAPGRERQRRAARGHPGADLRQRPRPRGRRGVGDGDRPAQAGTVTVPNVVLSVGGFSPARGRVGGQRQAGADRRRRPVLQVERRPVVQGDVGVPPGRPGVPQGTGCSGGSWTPPSPTRRPTPASPRPRRRRSPPPGRRPWTACRPCPPHRAGAGAGRPCAVPLTDAAVTVPPDRVTASGVPEVSVRRA